MPTKKKSCLMTPDPYHTPGYAGYVPQFKYDVGQTFGIHTHKLLTSTDPKVASSGNSVLCDIFPSPTSSVVEFSDSPIYSNTMRSWGDQKYLPHMVPGYAGFIPKGQHYFATRYAETCHNALTSFEQEQHKHRTKMEELRNLSNYRGQTDAQSPQNSATSNITTPLRPLRAKAKPYYSSQPLTLVSPYCVPPDDQPTGRYHMSGYMGFVPKAQRFIAQGYPIITNQALREHALETEKQVLSKSQPVTVHRPPQKPIKSVEIYPKHRGLVPRYCGYVPGQKFRFGGTFGSSTRDPLRPVAA